jgi:mannose-6-phosphate isomerase-like protein (cupin superfamily)
MNIDHQTLRLHIPDGKFEIDYDHDWGYQVRMVNTDKYAAKLLVMTNSTPSSLHHHADMKEETFVVLSGKVQVELPDGKHTLNPGDIVRIPHFITHRISAPDGEAVILEVSTHDDDAYTFRIPGAKYKSRFREMSDRNERLNALEQLEAEK